MSGFTLIFQIVNFLVLMALLRRFLFKPVLGMVQKRRHEIEAARAEGERLRSEAIELHASAERALAAAADTQARALGEARAQAEREHASAVEATRRETAALLEAAKRDIEGERDKAAEAMAKGAVTIGLTLSRQLLGQLGTGPVLDSFLTRLCQAVEHLTAERKRALRQDLEGRDLIIATAPALDTEATGRWLAEIDSRLGPGLRMRAVTDDSLLAGAELRFPHAAISFCWRDGVQAAEKELARS